MNTLVKIGLFAVGGYAIYKIATLVGNVTSFVNNLGFAIKAGDKPIRIGGSLLSPTINLNLDCEFTNPTNVSLEIKKPVIKILYKGTILAQSPIPKDTDIIKIDPKSVSLAKDFKFTINIADPSVIGALIDMGKVLGTGIAVNAGDSLITKVSSVVSVLSSNLDNLLPLFDISCLIYVGDKTFTYNTKIV